MSNQTPQPPETDGLGNEAARGEARATAEALAGNPYAHQYQRSAEPDLDASAPELRSSELRRMNHRALLLLGAVVLLLLFVAYWMIKSAGTPRERSKPREEKVSVTEAPAVIVAPPLPQRPLPSLPRPIPLMPASAQAPQSQPLAQMRPAASAPGAPTLLQRRIEASSASFGSDAAPPATFPSQLPPGGLPAGQDVGRTSAQPLSHPDTLMQRGTYIRCVLETRIISDLSGYSTCLVTEPVYSFNGHTLLLPKGSKLLGSYDKGPVGQRMAVIWDRIITPTGIDVNMKSPGIDNLGSAGLPGYYDAHWAQRISSALFISMLSDAFKYEAAKHGPTTTTIAAGGVAVQEPFQSNTAQTVQNLANQAVQAAANRPATVTINQGTVIYVYVAKDVDFSAVVARF